MDDALLAEFEDIAFRFAGDWLWFDAAAERDTALERRRYADHGWPVRGANLRADRMLAIGPSGRLEALAPEARELLGRLRGAWEAMR
ncbi:MAG: hypothetical protein P8Y76_16040 [bacterium]